MKSNSHWSARCDPDVGSQAIAELTLPFAQHMNMQMATYPVPLASQIPFLEGLEGIEKGRSVESLHADCASAVILHCRAEIGNTSTVSHKPGEVLQGISRAFLLAGLQMESCQAKRGQPCSSET